MAIKTIAATASNPRGDDDFFLSSSALSSSGEAEAVEDIEG